MRTAWVRRRKYTLAMLLAAVTVGLVAVVYQGSRAADDPSRPPRANSATVRTPYYNANLKLTLSPPQSGQESPPIDADQASDIAWAEGVPGDATAETDTYGLLSWGDDFVDRPVWVVTYEGVCQYAAGGARIEQKGTPASPIETTCFVRPFNTVIDANTGDFLFSYTDGSSPQEPSDPLPSG